MPIALGVIVVALLALGFMSMQVMLTKLQQEQENDSFWAHVLSPVTSALGLLNKGQSKLFDLMVDLVSRLAGASIRALADWFGHLERLVADAAHGVSSLAETVADAFEHAFTTTIPHMIRTAVRHEGHLRRIADEQLRRYARGIDRLLRDHVLPRLRAAERAITVTIPRELGRIRAREKAIAGRIPRALKHRLTRLEKITTGAAIMAVVWRALYKRFGWLACRRLTARKTGLFSRLCGLDPTMMESLLSSALVVLSLVELRALARGLETPTSLTMNGLAKFIRELDDLR